MPTYAIWLSKAQNFVELRPKLVLSAFHDVLFVFWWAGFRKLSVMYIGSCAALTSSSVTYIPHPTDPCRVYACRNGMFVLPRSFGCPDNIHSLPGLEQPCSRCRGIGLQHIIPYCSDVNKTSTLKAKANWSRPRPRPNTIKATVPRPRPSRLGMKLVLYRHERPWVTTVSK